MTNKELLDKYPWLTPSNRFSGKLITDCAGPDGETGYWPGSPNEHPDYNYEYTELDNMPDGWRTAFGMDMCEELNNEISTWEPKDQNNFRILDIKEKWASLRFYTNFGSENLFKIISKYELISKYTCIQCGEEAQWIARGWYEPLCTQCARKQIQNVDYDWREEFIDIDKFYQDE